MTKFQQVIKINKNLDLAKAVANFSIDGDESYAAGINGMGTIFGITNALGSAISPVNVKLTFYKSTSSNIKYATIEVFDTAFQERLNNDTGYIKYCTNREGRTEKMYLSKEHAKGEYQYDGYIDSNGEFCLAFHTYPEDEIAVRESEEGWNPTWITYPRYRFGSDNGHNSLFAPLKASGDTVNLLNQCIQ